MKSIKIILCLLLVFTLTSCFEKAELDDNSEGEENSQQVDENVGEWDLSEESLANDDEPSEPETPVDEEQNDNLEGENAENDEEAQNDSSEIPWESELEVSGSWEIQEEILEEYEDELEELFNDILGEVNE